MLSIRKRSHSQSTGLSWVCARRICVCWVCAWRRADTRSIIRQGNIQALLRTWVRKDEQIGTHTWNKLPSPPSYNICLMTCKRCFSLSKSATYLNCDILSVVQTREVGRRKVERNTKGTFSLKLEKWIDLQKVIETIRIRSIRYVESSWKQVSIHCDSIS